MCVSYLGITQRDAARSLTPRAIPFWDIDADRVSGGRRQEGLQNFSIRTTFFYTYFFAHNTLHAAAARR